MCAFKAFLSHRYKSPEINLYFFNVFREVAQVQFEVDEGVFSTSVTRLEQMIRNADAFIGIYPFPGTSEDARKPDELKKQSRYFRLEVDLALRSQKPAMIFFDRRYGSLFNIARIYDAVAYDVNEVSGTGELVRYPAHLKAFETFVEKVMKKKAYDDAIAPSRNTVGILVPSCAADEPGYDPSCIARITQIIRENMMYELVDIPWPPVLQPHTISLLDALDLCIIDLSPRMFATGVPAYLHGRFIPQLRLRYRGTTDTVQSGSDALYSGVEVGYGKDIAEWTDIEDLQQQLAAKLAVVQANVRRINTHTEAETYFRGASLRTENIFLSYAGEDADLVSKISELLKKRFRKVFDYKDTTSIAPGKPWLEGIFDQLAASAIGIPLYSKSYLESDNCKHELQQMAANADNTKMKILPVKLHDEELALPSYIQHIQYIRRYDYPDTEALIQAILRNV